MLLFQADIRSGSGGRWGAVTGPKGVRHDTGDSRNRSRRKCLWGHGLGSPVALLAGARRPLAFFDAKTLEGSRARLCKCHGASLPTTVQQRKPGGTPGDPAKPAAEERATSCHSFLLRRGFALVLMAEASRGEFVFLRAEGANPIHIPSLDCRRTDVETIQRRFQATTRRSVREDRRVDFSGVLPHSFPPSFMDNTTLSDTTQASSASKRPLKTIREEDCSASIWPRTVTKEGSERTFYSVTLERRYKDKDGQFHYTKSFDVGSMSQLAAVIKKTNDELQALQAGN